MLTHVDIDGAGTYQIDISSLSGSYYIGVFVQGYDYNKASVTTTEVVLNNYGNMDAEKADMQAALQVLGVNVDG